MKEQTICAWHARPASHSLSYMSAQGGTVVEHTAPPLKWSRVSRAGFSALSWSVLYAAKRDLVAVIKQIKQVN